MHNIAKITTNTIGNNFNNASLYSFKYFEQFSLMSTISANSSVIVGKFFELTKIIDVFSFNMKLFNKSYLEKSGKNGCTFVVFNLAIWLGVK